MANFDLIVCDNPTARKSKEEWRELASRAGINDLSIKMINDRAELTQALRAQSTKENDLLLVSNQDPGFVDAALKASPSRHGRSYVSVALHAPKGSTNGRLQDIDAVFYGNASRPFVISKTDPKQDTLWVRMLEHCDKIFELSSAI